MKFPVRMVGAHGAMHAYDTGELERLQKLGWSIETPVTDPVVNGGTSREPEDVIDAEKAVKPLADHVALIRKAIIEAEFQPLVTEPLKRKPGRPRKAE